MKRNFTLTIALFFSILTMGQTATVFFDVQTEKKDSSSLKVIW